MLQLPLDPAKFKWPYDGILNDLRAAIEGNVNFLAALGLLVYTEVVGRWILQERSVKMFTNEDSFYCYYEEFMGRKGARRKKIYELYRHGLAHGYSFNAADLSRVRMRPDPNWIPSNSQASVISLKGRRIKSFLVNAYFRDFQRGLTKWASEKPNLVLLPEKSLGNQQIRTHHRGNYQKEALDGPYMGWIVGKFVKNKDDPRKTNAVEIKYWEFPTGPTKHESKTQRTIEVTLLLAGKVEGPHRY